jgi:hypothetical protein
MKGDVRRERNAEAAAVRPVLAPAVLPDGVAFGLTAGGMMLGVLLAKAEEASARIAEASRLIDRAAHEATPDPHVALPNISAVTAATGLLPAMAPSHHAPDEIDAAPSRPDAATTAPPGQATSLDPAEKLHQPASDALTQAHSSSAEVAHGATPSTDHAGTGMAALSLEAAHADGASSAMSLADGVSHVVTDVTASLQDGLHDAIATMDQTLTQISGQVPIDLGAATSGLVDATATIVSAAASATSLLEGLPSALLGAPDILPSANGVLASAFGTVPTAAAASLGHSPETDSPHNVANVVLPAMADLAQVNLAQVNLAHVDHGADSSGAIQLGFLGQSYLDAVDAHDLASHTIGSPFHGFV